MHRAAMLKRMAAAEKGGRLCNPPWMTIQVLPQIRHRTPVRTRTLSGEGGGADMARTRTASLPVPAQPPRSTGVSLHTGARLSALRLVERVLREERRLQQGEQDRERGDSQGLEVHPGVAGEDP